MLNEYNRIARIYPAILCSIPIFVLNYFLLDLYTADFLGVLEDIKWISGVTISVVLTFLFAQAGRFIGKELFEKLHFADELQLPTTQSLLHSDPTYSLKYKGKIHAKILTDFDIQVYSVELEKSDNHGARKVLAECVSMIRGKVKDGRLLLQHNIEYGFVRNLIGGSVIAVFISIINLFLFGYFFENALAFLISLFLAVVYLLVIMFGRPLINMYGIRYARVLIQEYLLT